MLEYWGRRNKIHLYMDDIDRTLTSEHHPFFKPNIPFFHHSIIPVVIEQQTSPLRGKIKAWSFGPGFFTFIRDPNCVMSDVTDILSINNFIPIAIYFLIQFFSLTKVFR